MCLTLGVISVTAAEGNVNLEFRSVNPWIVGHTVEVGLYATWSQSDQATFSTLRTHFEWDPAYLDLISFDQTGAAPLMSASFPQDDPWDLNETVPPKDGDGIFSALASFGTPIDTSAEDVLITTFLFEALAPTAGTMVSMDVVPSPQVSTAVVDGVIPGLDITGSLEAANVVIELPEPTLAVVVLTALFMVGMRRSARTG